MSIHISDFFLGERLGQGSFSRVYYARYKRGRDTFLRDALHVDDKGDKKGDVFAIKIVNKKSIQRRSQYVSMILNEKDILCCLQQHENIVNLFATWVSDENLFFLLELCATNLSSIMGNVSLKNNSKNGTDESDLIRYRIKCTRYYMTQLLSAIEYLHAHSLCIVHRDIKPDNILISDNGKDHLIKLSDFGFATALNIEGCHQKFVDQILGSPDYSSPEAKVVGSKISVSFDLWAFGCIVFEFVAGHNYHAIRNLDILRNFILEIEGGMEAMSLVEEMLKIDEVDRLGLSDSFGLNSEYKSIREHSFFYLQKQVPNDFQLPQVAALVSNDVVDCLKPNWEFLLERDFD